ncbi:glycosyltransferase [Clostridium prolinivorans]|uniref:glycosyltransferase n=1 Tax=Clostridium prolinivorans TaxID=2769420 RepID=UPI000FD8B7FC|nr:hypothetical protein [Clostridium prolinivorans]
MNTQKKALLCFYKGNILKEDMGILEYLDSKKFEIHLFNDVDENNLNFDNLFYLLNALFDKNVDNYEIYLASNVKEFIMIEYILYKQWIKGFLYLNNNVQHIETDNIYTLILKEMISNIDAKNFYLIKDESGIFKNYNIFNKDFETDKFDINFENEIYSINGENHIFSIKSNLKTNIIKVNSSDFCKNNIYTFHYDLNYVDNFLNEIEYYSNTSINEFAKNIGYIQSFFEKFKSILDNINSYEKELVKFKMEKELFEIGKNDILKIFLGSALLYLYNKKIYIEFIAKTLVNSKTLSKENKFFCYYQLKRYNFINNIEDKEIYKLFKLLYDNICEEYLVKKSLKKIQRYKRNKQLIFVFTSQFLSEHHAPTKLAMDTCYNLIKHFNKNVILINIKECLTLKGLIPMINVASANVIEEYYSINSINYKDVSIPFYQPDVHMPNDDEIDNILNMVKKYKPYLIINIGQSLIGDIASNIVPAVTLPLGMYEYSRSDFCVVNDMQEKEEYIQLYNLKEKNIIISKFAFEIKEQVKRYEKKQIGIPYNKFILSIVGNRLNCEIDDDFLNILDRCCKQLNAYVVFINNFTFNSNQKKRYEYLYNNYKNMGYQEDLLAIMEHIDLFVNPKRKGGGTSAIYALYKGKPVVTLNFGDVAKNVGREFCCDSYEEMYDLIKEYYFNKDFYIKQGIIAKEIALFLTDTKLFIKNIFNELNNSTM